MSDQVTTGSIFLMRPGPDRNKEPDLPFVLQSINDSSGPFLVIVVGREQRTRRNSLKSQIESRTGATCYAPDELGNCLDHQGFPEPAAVVSYLLSTGFSLLRTSSIRVVLPTEFPATLVAGLVEAVATHPNGDITIGGRVLSLSDRWDRRRRVISTTSNRARVDFKLGRSKAMQEVSAQIDRYADSPLPVLVVGETGTGKGVVALQLHRRSGRPVDRFAEVNSAELESALAESLLFGHVEGAFTGAHSDRAGRIQEAVGGTFFLDELFDLPKAMQARLLTAFNKVDEGKIIVQRVGETRANHVDVRLVVAAKEDPRLRGDRIRDDLYYRIANGIIWLPPLRERKEDVQFLGESMIAEWASPPKVEEAFWTGLKGHDWPGNVRELKLVLNRARLLAGEGRPLTAELLPHSIDTARDTPLRRCLPLPCKLKEEMARMELATMEEALEAESGNNTAAGIQIGLSNTNARNFGRMLKTLRDQVAGFDSTSHRRLHE